MGRSLPDRDNQSVSVFTLHKKVFQVKNFNWGKTPFSFFLSSSGFWFFSVPIYNYGYRVSSRVFYQLFSASVLGKCGDVFGCHD
jgi:hypothetical protein